MEENRKETYSRKEERVKWKEGKIWKKKDIDEIWNYTIHVYNINTWIENVGVQGKRKHAGQNA